MVWMVGVAVAAGVEGTAVVAAAAALVAGGDVLALVAALEGTSELSGTADDGPI